MSVSFATWGCVPGRFGHSRDIARDFADARRGFIDVSGDLTVFSEQLAHQSTDRVGRRYCIFWFRGRRDRRGGEVHKKELFEHLRKQTGDSAGDDPTNETRYDVETL